MHTTILHHRNIDGYEIQVVQYEGDPLFYVVDYDQDGDPIDQDAYETLSEAKYIYDIMISRLSGIPMWKLNKEANMIKFAKLTDNSCRAIYTPNGIVIATVRKEQDTYFVHPVDRAIPPGNFPNKDIAKAYCILIAEGK